MSENAVEKLTGQTELSGVEETLAGTEILGQSNDSIGNGHAQYHSNTDKGQDQRHADIGNELGRSDANTEKSVKAEIAQPSVETDHFGPPLRKKKIWHRMFTSCITLHKGWRIYKNYDVAFAGLGLASLYLTVLGFHHITTGE